MEASLKAGVTSEAKSAERCTAESLLGAACAVMGRGWGRHVGGGGAWRAGGASSRAPSHA
jgi:hypothetical protein